MEAIVTNVNHLKEFTMNDETYKNLFAELEQIEHSGVSINLNDHPASPMQIVTAHMVREESNYMRDYVWDEKGEVKKLIFTEIKKK